MCVCVCARACACFPVVLYVLMLQCWSSADTEDVFYLFRTHFPEDLKIPVPSVKFIAILNLKVIFGFTLIHSDLPLSVPAAFACSVSREQLLTCDWQRSCLSWIIVSSLLGEAVYHISQFKEAANN